MAILMNLFEQWQNLKLDIGYIYFNKCKKKLRGNLMKF
jgi:hypothetical protein